MLRKTIELASPGSRLSVKNAQLRVQRKDAREVNIPIEDIGVLIVDDRQAVYTQSVFIDLLEAGGMVLVTNRNHLPAGMMLPIEGHHEQTKRQNAQLSLSKPRKKGLWKTLIKTKIRLQADMLEQHILSDAGLRRLAERVRSGDPDNYEAQAAQRYWPRLFGSEFRRNRDKPGVNGLLNYGYSVMRAGIARALVGSGLLPSQGVFHRNRRNAFCLADDMLEPYRPLVDWQVRRILNADVNVEPSLEVRAHRATILALFNRTIMFTGSKLPVLIAMERTARSLVSCCEMKESDLELPESLPLELQDVETEGE